MESVWRGKIVTLFFFDEPFITRKYEGNGGIEHGEISALLFEWAGGARTALGLRQLPMVGQSNFRFGRL